MAAKSGAYRSGEGEREERPKRSSATAHVAESSATNLDRLIHERIRLGIVSALAANSSLTFNDLKRLLKTTDGNLSVHARKLEEARYIDCVKSFEGRMPKTEYSLTATGRKALRAEVGSGLRTNRLALDVHVKE